MCANRSDSVTVADWSGSVCELYVNFLTLWGCHSDARYQARPLPRPPGRFSPPKNPGGLFDFPPSDQRQLARRWDTWTTQSLENPCTSRKGRLPAGGDGHTGHAAGYGEPAIPPAHMRDVFTNKFWCETIAGGGYTQRIKSGSHGRPRAYQLGATPEAWGHRFTTGVAA